MKARTVNIIIFNQVQLKLLMLHLGKEVDQSFLMM